MRCNLVLRKLPEFPTGAQMLRIYHGGAVFGSQQRGLLHQGRLAVMIKVLYLKSEHYATGERNAMLERMVAINQSHERMIWEPI